MSTPVQARQGTLFQFSTIDALLAGLYDGEMTMKQLKHEGTFGLGTFDRLNGEMVVLDGNIYRVTAHGTVEKATEQETTPFAAVLPFSADFSIPLSDITSLQQLNEVLDTKLPSLNYFYAIRIDTTLPNLTTRSVPAQNKPYPPLKDVVEHQAIFQLNGQTGTLIGLRCPTYVKGINVTGYHWHFINTDRTKGGHVLKLTFPEATAHISSATNLQINLPKSNTFSNIDLNKDRTKALHKVEKE
jgi:acetolactate decarboxylase